MKSAFQNRNVHQQNPKLQNVFRKIGDACLLVDSAFHAGTNKLAEEIEEKAGIKKPTFAFVNITAAIMVPLVVDAATGLKPEEIWESGILGVLSMAIFKVYAFYLEKLSKPIQAAIAEHFTIPEVQFARFVTLLAGVSSLSFAAFTKNAQFSSLGFLIFFTANTLYLATSNNDGGMLDRVKYWAAEKIENTKAAFAKPTAEQLS